MSKSGSTRAAKTKEQPTSSSKPNVNASALRKIFYISQLMLDDGTQKLRLERFFHPGKGKSALFMTKDDKHILEVMEFAEPRRSWLINSEVCSNGHIYITTPVDATFLALYHLRKHCMDRALSLDNIHDDEDVTVSRLLNDFINPDVLRCVADVKTAGGDMQFYKYNHDKCLAWLSLKTNRIIAALKNTTIYCGNSSVSQNFARSEKVKDETATEMDLMRMACDYIGGYLTLDLHEDLIRHLKIPCEKVTASDEKKTATTKRKSGEKLNDLKKKQKLENGAAAKLKDTSILDESPDDEVENRNNNSIKEESSISPKDDVTTPLKERSLSAKEKTLAKSAKGTKSITSFFMKKIT